MQIFTKKIGHFLQKKFWNNVLFENSELKENLLGNPVCKGVVEKEILTIFKLFFEVTFGGNADLPVMTDRLLRNPWRKFPYLFSKISITSTLEKDTVGSSLYSVGWLDFSWIFDVEPIKSCARFWCWSLNNYVFLLSNYNGQPAIKIDFCYLGILEFLVSEDYYQTILYCDIL